MMLLQNYPMEIAKADNATNLADCKFLFHNCATDASYFYLVSKIQQFKYLVSRFFKLDVFNGLLIDEKPNEESVNNALGILEIYGKGTFAPNLVAPMEDGGIIIEHFYNGVYASFDIYNTGEIFYTKRSKKGDMPSRQIVLEDIDNSYLV